MAISAEVKSLDQVEYSFGVHRLLLILLVLVAFFVAFLAYFPLERKVETLVKAQMAKLPGCRINFENLHFEFFLPKVLLTDVQVPGSCLGGESPLKMRQMALKFQGPSFSPLGLALKLETDVAGHTLGVNYAAGTSTQVFNIQESNVPMAVLKTLVPKIPKMEGNVALNAKIELQGQALQDVQLLIESKNLAVPAQNLSDFKLPRLVLGDLRIKAQSKGPRKIAVEEFIIGKADAAIRGKFSGTVDLVPGATAFSPVSLKGEAAFAPDFLQSFPILNLMLPQFTQKDGFYQINLGGTLGNIRPN